MTDVPPAPETEANGQAGFDRECARLNSLARDVEKINRMLQSDRLGDRGLHLQRRSELLGSWWREWMRLLPLARAAGIPLAQLRELQPPIV
jgi:hypothetical protein